MKVTLIAISLIILTGVEARAQTTKPKATFGVNLTFIKPVGAFANQVKFGVGPEVYGGLGWEKTYVIATTGYQILADNFCLCNDPIEYVPIKLGLKQLIANKSMFVQGDAGIASIKFQGGARSYFGYDIGLGLQLSKFQLGLFYDAYNQKGLYSPSSVTKSMINLKIGYNYFYNKKSSSGY